MSHNLARPAINVRGLQVRLARLQLRPRDVAPILRLSQHQLVHMTRSGKLTDISADRLVRLDPIEVVALAEQRAAAGLIPNTVIVTDLVRLLRTPANRRP